MDDCSLVEIFWALAVISFPVCMLLLAIIFKDDIKQLLARIGDKESSEKNIQHTAKVDQKNIEVTDEGYHKNYSKKESVKSQIQSYETDYISVDICKNINSSQYFIILDEKNNDNATMIIPNGEIKNLELKLFCDFGIEKIGELLKNKLITNEQLTKYMKYIEDDAGRYFEDYEEGATRSKKTRSSTSDEPYYIKNYRNMLKNPDTWPSRMLEIIAKEKKISSKKLRDTIVKKYLYSTSETNGSFHASLRLLLVDGYISIEGNGDNKTIKIIHQ